MKRSISLFILLAVFVIGASAQKFEKPTLTPKPLTDVQKTLVEEGIALHDQKKYDAAILKYELVLGENPDATIALYEKVVSLHDKGDRALAISEAVRGTKYKSDQLPLFYMSIANMLDDQGKPQEAIRIYRDAIKILKGEKGSEKQLSSIHFNLGITYFRQKAAVEARTELKKAVEYNPLYSSPHFVLSELYIATEYKVPALLAAIRFISLEYNTVRTDRAVATFLKVMAPAKKDEKTGNINIFMNLNAPKDEGDFGMYDLLLGTITMVRTDEDKGKSDAQVYAEGVESMLSIISGDKKLKKTFVGEQYLPFLIEMKARGYGQMLAYIALYKSDEKNKEALDWLGKNGAKMEEFFDWAKTYRPPVK